MKTPPLPAPGEQTAVENLSLWFERVARALPWRATRDPYSIWISEVMLQQTQVATVIPYYLRFLEKFPTVEALATAPEPEVLQAWSGLGYYSRARNLRKAAQYLLAHHRASEGVAFPRTRDGMLAVPGIGPYTAGAVLSIAFDLPIPIVDGNVQRVFARYFGIEEAIELKASQSFFWRKAEDWVLHARSPRVLNQALMELGATTCVKGSPRCGQCPIAAGCVARREGKEKILPIRKPKREKVDLYWIALVAEHEGKLFVRENAKGTWWEGLLDFPRLEARDALALDEEAHAAAEAENAQFLQSLGRQKHTVTHHRLTVAPYLLRLDKPRGRRFEGGRWLAPREIKDAPISSLARKILTAYAQNHGH